MEDFESFLLKRETAAREFCRGRPEALLAMSSRQDPVSFFGPDGTIVEGAETVNATNKHTAAGFGAKGQSSFEILQSGSDADIGYWCGVQQAMVEVDGNLTPMMLRVTEVFRREGGTWKLAHRHADTRKG